MPPEDSFLVWLFVHRNAIYSRTFFQEKAPDLAGYFSPGNFQFFPKIENPPYKIVSAMNSTS